MTKPHRAYEKRESWRDKASRRVSWIVHGKTASVEVWIQAGTESGFDRSQFKGEPCWAGGFAGHSRQGDGKPSGENCQTLGGRCWHDGSSLAASEFFQVWDQRDDSAFAECESWLASQEKQK